MLRALILMALCYCAVGCKPRSGELAESRSSSRLPAVPTESSGSRFQSDALELGEPESGERSSNFSASTRMVARALPESLNQDLSNSSPIADAGGDQMIVSGAGLEAVRLDGTGSSDPDADPLNFEWLLPAFSGASIDNPFSPTPVGLFPVGPTLVTLVVTDGKGGIGIEDVLITVGSVSSSALICATDQIALWPANDEMHEVLISVSVSDRCSNIDDFFLLCEISSNEPDRGEDDRQLGGDVAGEDGYSKPALVPLIYDADLECFVGSATLRAETNTDEVSRVYSIVCDVSDSSGHTETASCVVVVPQIHGAD